MSQCHDIYEPDTERVQAEPVPVVTQCHDFPETPGEVDSPELTVAHAVEEWAERLAPDDTLVARAAVDSALYRLACGASVPEAVREGRGQAIGRLLHPSHDRGRATAAAAL